MKKLIALLMALCLLLSAGAALADVTYPIKTDKPVKLKVWMEMKEGASQVFTKYMENPVYQRFSEVTGIELEMMHPTYGAAGEGFSRAAARAGAELAVLDVPAARDLSKALSMSAVPTPLLSGCLGSTTASASGSASARPSSTPASSARGWTGSRSTSRRWPPKGSPGRVRQVQAHRPHPGRLADQQQERGHGEQHRRVQRLREDDHQ